MAEQRVERRLTAILAGDVAGYSRLMGVDGKARYRGSMLTGVNSWNLRLPSIAAASSSGPATAS